MCILCDFRAQLADGPTQTIDPLDPAAFPLPNLNATSDASTALAETDLPTYSVDQVAHYLTNVFWENNGATRRSFDLDADGTVTVDLDALGEVGKSTARAALDAWTQASGITFVEAADTMITFSEDRSGAFSASTVQDGVILSSRVHVDDDWTMFGDYYFQVYMHEIGHALGLGHPGVYNFGINFNRDAHFANDSWQMSILSYFDQGTNPYVDASRMFVSTPQVADVAAIQSLYGVATTIRTGDTTYGDGGTGADTALATDRAQTLVDNGGVDTIDLSSRGSDQNLDLRQERFSDLDGKIGNLSIARHTIIENARMGAGQDRITGNDSDNALAGGAGDDTILGGAGDDTLTGGQGADVLSGGAGADLFVYAKLAEAGDVIEDFASAQGDRMDLLPLLQSIGFQPGQSDVADFVALRGAEDGAEVIVTSGGMETRLAFLQGLNAASVSLSELLAPIPAGNAYPIVSPTPDTTFDFSDKFVWYWTAAAGRITDTNGGTDTIDLRDVSFRSAIDLAEEAPGAIAARTLVISDGSVIENLLLGRNDDRGQGNDAGNMIDGGAGDDRLFGGGGSDSLYGGTGLDRITGGFGDDVLYGGADNDTLAGGIGDDTLAGDTGDDVIRGQSAQDSLDGGAGDDRLFGGTQADVLMGGEGNDYALGQGGDDLLRGGDGADVLRGGSGHDTLDGGDGADQLFGNGNDDLISGGAGNDVIQGNAGADLLFGGAGNDWIIGGAGADRLDGGAGNDTLQGGGGTAQDVFVFGAGAGHDRINGFDQIANDLMELDDALWARTDPALSGQDVVDIFGMLNETGTILTLDFGSGDVLEVQNAGGIDVASLGADIFIV